MDFQYQYTQDGEKLTPEYMRGRIDALTSRIRADAAQCTAESLALLRSPLTLQPFLIACATKSTKVTTLALGAIQRLLSVGAVVGAQPGTVIGTLRIQAESKDQTVQLKILQTLTLALAPLLKAFTVSSVAAAEAESKRHRWSSSSRGSRGRPGSPGTAIRIDDDDDDGDDGNDGERGASDTHDGPRDPSRDSHPGDPGAVPYSLAIEADSVVRTSTPKATATPQRPRTYSAEDGKGDAFASSSTGRLPRPATSPSRAPKSERALSGGQAKEGRDAGVARTHDLVETSSVENIVLQAFSICFRLVVGSQDAVRHTAFATLRQVTQLLWDCVAAVESVRRPTLMATSPSSSSSDGASKPAPLAVRMAQGLICDLCTLSRGDSTDMRWLAIPRASQVPPTACLDLIEHILTSRRDLLQNDPDFSELVQGHVCITVISQLRSSFEFPKVLRLVRVAVLLVQRFRASLVSECEMILSIFVRMLEPDFPLWHRVLVLEAVSGLCADPALIYDLFLRYDARPPATKIFGSIAHVLSKFVQQPDARSSSAGPAMSTSSAGLGASVNDALSQSGSMSGAREPSPSAQRGLVSMLSSLAGIRRMTMGGGSSGGSGGGSGARGRTKSRADRASAGASGKGRGGGGGVGGGSYATKSKSKGLRLLNDAAPPNYSESHMVTVAVTAMTRILRSLGALTRSTAKQATSENSSKKLQGVLAPKGAATKSSRPISSREDAKATVAVPNADRAVCSQMVSIAWYPLLAGLAHLLGQSSRPSETHMVLVSFQGFAETCFLLGIHEGAASLVDTLCKHAVPARFQAGSTTTGGAAPAAPARDLRELRMRPALLTAKNIQVLKSLFNVAHCLGDHLGSTWLPILTTFSTLDDILALNARYQRIAGAQAGSSSGGGGSSRHSTAVTCLPDQAQVDLLEKAMNHLFESTKSLSDASLSHLLSALGSLGLTALANVATAEATSEGIEPLRDAGGRAGVRRFCLARLLQTIESNLGRALAPALNKENEGAETGAEAESSADSNAIEEKISDTTVNTKSPGGADPHRFDLWEAAMGYLNILLNHRSADIRQQGMQNLGRFVRRVLATAAERHRSARAAQGAAQGAAQPRDDKGLERKILSPIADFLKSKYADTRSGALGVLHSVLQTHAQHMSSGWPVVLSLLHGIVSRPAPTSATLGGADGDGSAAGQRTLAQVPRASMADAKLGLESLQLVTSDFLDAIPISNVPVLVDTIRAFAAQNLDVNISFQAVTLLWTISDFLKSLAAQTGGKLRRAVPPRAVQTQQPQPAADGRGGRSGARETPPSALPRDASHKISAEELDNLAMSVFDTLRMLSADPRSQVRTSAIKTFQSTVVAHGPRLSARAWVRCLNEIVFPMMTDLLDQTQDAKRTDVKETELGRDRGTGKSVRMMLHFSRDTARKQWDQTRVFALGAVAALFKNFAPRMVGTDGDDQRQFSDAWVVYLSHVHFCVRRSSSEVAQSALTTLLDAVLGVASIAGSERHRNLWVEALRLLVKVSSSALKAAPGLFGPSGVRADAGSQADGAGDELPARGDLAERWISVQTRLVQVLASVCATLQGVLTENDYEIILNIAHMLSSVETLPPAPARPDPSAPKPSLSDTLRRQKLCNLKLRAASLDLFESLPTLPPRLWRLTFSRLMSYALGGGAETGHAGKSLGRQTLPDSPPPRSMGKDDVKLSSHTRTPSVSRSVLDIAVGLLGGGTSAPAADEATRPSPQELNTEGSTPNALQDSYLRLDADVRTLWAAYARVESSGVVSLIVADPAPRGFAHRALGCCIETFCGKATSALQSEALPRLMETLNVLLFDVKAPAWRVALRDTGVLERGHGAEFLLDAATGLTRVLGACLPAAAYLDSAQIDTVWIRLCETLARLLEAPLLPVPQQGLPPNTEVPASRLLRPSDDQALEDKRRTLRARWAATRENIADCLVRVVVPHSRPAPPRVQRALRVMLQSVVAADTRGEDRALQRRGLAGLVYLCQQGGSRETQHSRFMDAARTAAPLLLSRAESLLREYVKVDEESNGGGKDAKAEGNGDAARNPKTLRALKEQVLFLLRELGALRIHPQISRLLLRPEAESDTGRAQLQAPTETPRSPRERMPRSASDRAGWSKRMSPSHSRARDADFAAFGSRGHLVALYPALCECIVVRDHDIRKQLVQTMRVIGKELLLGRSE